VQHTPLFLLLGLPCPPSLPPSLPPYLEASLIRNGRPAQLDDNHILLHFLSCTTAAAAVVAAAIAGACEVRQDVGARHLLSFGGEGGREGGREGGGEVGMKRSKRECWEERC